MTPARVPFDRPRSRMLALALAAMALGASGHAQVGDSMDTGSSRPLYTPPAIIYFPPVPPPLDRPVNHLTQTVPGRLTPPPELAAYINEPFYPPLSTQLTRRDLDPKLRQRLDAYRSTRDALRGELSTELDRVRDLEAPARRTALETFARRQLPRLVELEKTAELLRENLITNDDAWSAQREWHLGDKDQRGFSPAEISQVMRAYAFYQKGLLPAQRRLLREISFEMAVAGENTASATAAQPFLFFSPEPARVLLPDDLPADLAAKVAAYQTKKSTLKKELYDAVYAEDGLTLGFLRPSGLKALAGRQADRLAALETLAEEIRRALGELPQPPRPGDRSPLPPVLTARVAAVLTSRTALHKETVNKIERARSGMPVQLTYSFDNEGLKFRVGPGRSARGGMQPSDIKRMIDSVETAMSAIAADYGRRFAELANETDGIRHDIGEGLGKTTPVAIDTALAAAVRFVALQESDTAFRDYRTAVFEPGLSPEQRRLLFGGAIEKLDLPLPRGELQPTRRSQFW